MIENAVFRNTLCKEIVRLMEQKRTEVTRSARQDAFSL